MFKAGSLWGRVFPIELEFGSISFYGGRKTGEPGEKPSEQGREPTTNSTHMTLGSGIKPGPHWWEASALTTAPPLRGGYNHERWLYREVPLYSK